MKTLAQAMDAAKSAGNPSGKKPNILMIMGDDVGMWNISAYHRGMMGGRTPNIDRIAAEGACSQITMHSSHARRGEPRSSPVKPLFVLDC
jgi:hypothetical protein